MNIKFKMENIKSYVIMENYDCGYNLKTMNSNYTWQEVVNECYKMERKPNIIVRQGKGQYYLKYVPREKYYKIKSSSKSNLKMVIINWK